MSVAVTYNPDLFLFERASSLSSKVGEFLIGLSKIGAATDSVWVPVGFSSFALTSSYDVQDGVLIVAAETASVAMSYRVPADTWDDEYPLYSGDRVRASYDGEEIFLGTVDKTRVTYTAAAKAKNAGRPREISFQADMLGTYAAMMGQMICHGALPPETAIQRIRRWCTVTGW